MNKINPFGVFQHLRKIIFAAIVMAIFALAASGFGVNVLLIIAASVLIYFGILIALKEPLLKEIKLILQPAVSDGRGNGAAASQ